jgi:hypothetical protein
MNAYVRPPSIKRVFVSHYRPDRIRLGLGVLWVLSLAMAFGAAMSGGVPVVWFVVAGAASYYVWPLLHREQALKLGADGVTVDGVGRAPWEAVSRIRSREIVVDGRRITQLALTLGAPAEMAIVGDRPKPHRKLQMQIARVVDDQAIIINLSDLDDSPEDVIRAAEYFLGQRVESQRAIVA